MMMMMMMMMIMMMMIHSPAFVRHPALTDGYFNQNRIFLWNFHDIVLFLLIFRSWQFPHGKLYARRWENKNICRCLYSC